MDKTGWTMLPWLLCAIMFLIEPPSMLASPSDLAEDLDEKKLITPGPLGLHHDRHHHLSSDQVSLTISYPKTAATDSNMTFYLRINDPRSNATRPSFYTVSWWDDTVSVSLPSLTLTTGAYGNITKIYSDVAPKNYSMQIRVYDDIDLFKTVATESVSFTLTESLNGQMSLNQTWSYERQGAIVSSDVPFSLSINLTDVFSWKNVQVHWTVNNVSLIYNRTAPLQLKNILLKTAGKYTVQALVIAEVSVANKTLLTKHGSFRNKFEVADPIGDLTLMGADVVAVNKRTNVSIAYSGSTPVSICTSLGKYHNNLIPFNRSCEMFTFYNRTPVFHVLIYFNETGTYQLTANIINRVSNTTGFFYFHVYDPEQDNPLYIVLPVVFSMIGLVIILLAIAALIKYQKSPNVETADFGFHIHKVQQPSWMSKLISKIQVKFVNRRKRTMNINLDGEFPSHSRRSSVSSYGSMSVGIS